MEATKAPIYLLPGMAVDFPVFARLLPLLPNAFMVDFPVPYQRESLISYAWRMASLLPAQSFIAGVSFGGIVALEISRILRPLGCILISSIQHPKEFPPWIRACRVIGGRTCSQAMSIFGEVARYIPKSMRTPATLRAVQLDQVVIGIDGQLRPYWIGIHLRILMLVRYFGFMVVLIRPFRFDILIPMSLYRMGDMHYLCRIHLKPPRQ